MTISDLTDKFIIAQECEKKLSKINHKLLESLVGRLHTLLSFNNGSPWKSVVFICIGKLLPFRNKLTCIAKPRVQLISYGSVWCRLNVDTGYLTHHRQWFINMRMLGERFVVVSMVAGSTPFSTSILMVSDSFIIVRNVIEFHSAFN